MRPHCPVPVVSTFPHADFHEEVLTATDASSWLTLVLWPLVAAADLHGVNNLLFDGLVKHNFILHDFHCGSRQSATLVFHRKE